MKKSILILISGIALLLASACKKSEEPLYDIGEQRQTELDLIYDLMEEAQGTTDCLKYADQLFNKSKEYENEDYQVEAAVFKANAYIGLSDYNNAIAYADSITQVLGFTTDKPKRGYYDLIYAKCLAYISNGKYKAAINEAMQLYNQARVNIDKDPELELVVRCNALSCLGLANAAMGNLNEAFQNYEEAIHAILTETDNKEFLMQLLQIQTFRMQLASKYEDKQHAIALLDQYNVELQQFNEKKKGTLIEEYENNDWEMQMEMYYVVTYCELDRIDDARKHLQNVENIFTSFENILEQYVAEYHVVKSKFYGKTGDYVKAVEEADLAAEFYNTSSDLTSEYDALNQKYLQLYALGHYKESADAAKRLVTISDSLSAQRYRSSVEEMSTIMGVNKLENDKKELEAERQFWTFISIFVLMVALLVFFIFKRRRDLERQRILAAQKQMLEDEVARQTCELREQKEVIEQKNRDITDSINYALRIQQSILPDMSQYTPEVGVEGAFALFIPCHIVSGDFYWTFQRDNLLFFSSVDCTGHGVPGAFMSMIGTTILNDLCNRPEALAPNEILEQLHINLLAVLQQSGDADSRDGMDMSILEYNTETHHVRVSSARRPVYLHIGGEFVEYKGVKRSIGERDYTQETLPFSLGEYDVAAGDSVYMCSDGIGDQFGGPSNKRLKSSGLMKMLQELVILPIGEQQAAIDKMYWDWRGDQEQLDDISLIGVKF